MVKELNDFAGQREVVAENLMTQICMELSKNAQELKQERKLVTLSPSLSSSATVQGLVISRGVGDVDPAKP